MISKLIKFLPLIFKVLVLKNVEIDYKSKYPDSEKPKILQRRTISKIAVVLSSVLGAGTVLSTGEEVTAVSLMKHMQVLIDAGTDMYVIASQPEVMFAGGFLYALVALLFGRVFKTKGKITANKKGKVTIESS